MIVKEITKNQLEAHFKALFHGGNESDLLEMEVSTKEDGVNVTKRVMYSVEGLDQWLVYSMGAGWVLKETLDSRQETTLKEHFSKEQFEEEQTEKENKKQAISELEEMTPIEKLEACEGKGIVERLIEGELTQEQVTGKYNYKGVTVLEITKDTFFLKGKNNIISSNVNVFGQLVDLIEESDLPYDIESHM